MKTNMMKKKTTTKRWLTMRSPSTTAPPPRPPDARRPPSSTDAKLSVRKSGSEGFPSLSASGWPGSCHFLSFPLTEHLLLPLTLRSLLLLLLYPLPVVTSSFPWWVKLKEDKRWKKNMAFRCLGHGNPCPPHSSVLCSFCIWNHYAFIF